MKIRITDPRDNVSLSKLLKVCGVNEFTTEPFEVDVDTLQKIRNNGIKFSRISTMKVNIDKPTTTD